MKKIKYLFIISICIALFTSCSSSKTEQNVNVPSNNQIANYELMIEVCKKHLGEKNYYFINELYNDNEAAIVKCKLELGL